MNNISMKDSEIPLFGKIPAHWDVVRFENIFKEEKNKLGNEKGLELLTLSKKHGVIYRKESVGDVDENILSRAESFEDYKVVSPKMLVMNIMLAWDGVLDFSTKKGFVSPAYNVFKSKYDISYFKYLLKINLIHAYFRTESKGITDFRLRLYSNNFLKMNVFVPPKNEQEKIVAYLDIETSKIDKKISILEQKFTKLEEYKQSVIFETVTKGLNSNVAMKDSGIEWIGDIPAHWNILRLKDISIIKKGEAFDESLSSPDGIYPYINGGMKPSDWSNYFNTNENTIAVSEGGASAGYTQFMFTKYWAGSHCYKVKPKNKTINNKYVFYILKGFEKHLMIEKTGSAMPNLQKTKFINYLVSFVNNVEEQNQIVNYLDMEVSKIDKKKEIIKKKIELLKEYKQTVIYEAVTGKIEIN